MFWPHNWSALFNIQERCRITVDRNRQRYQSRLGLHFCVVFYPLETQRYYELIMVNILLPYSFYWSNNPSSCSQGSLYPWHSNIRSCSPTTHHSIPDSDQVFLPFSDYIIKELPFSQESGPSGEIKYIVWRFFWLHVSVLLFGWE